MIVLVDENDIIGDTIRRGGEMSTTADLLLHPVRLRIVQAFLGERRLTTAQLRTELTDVPPATLYRQINALVDAGVLEAAAHRPVRGAVERTFRLRVDRATVARQELAAMSPGQHRAAFLVFVAGLLADFDRYLDSGDVDLLRDLVGYRQAGFYCTDDELRECIVALQAAIHPWITAGPGPGRSRRMFTTVLMPAPAPAADAGQ
jgi:DNA-binding transcriptional ArsR family regulator